MKAMILAAGLGTRLYPLTKDKPKALIEVNGITLLEILIKKLIQYNVNEIIINIHHFADQIINFIKSKNDFGIKIEFSNEADLLLDTGGGLKKASWFFNNNEPFILHNADVISDIDLNELVNYHNQNKALATVCVKERETSRYLLLNDENVLCGWENEKTGEKIITKKNKNLKRLAFSGIHVINPEIFKYIEQEGVFSIINTYLQLSKEHTIKAFEHNENYMLDVGKMENLKEAEENAKWLISKQ